MMLLHCKSSVKLTKCCKVRLKEATSNDFQRLSVRTFFTNQIRFRNKNEIFNAEDRPDISMLESARQKVVTKFLIFCHLITIILKIKDGYRHPRSIPIISPSEEFDGNVLKIFDKGTCRTRKKLDFNFCDFSVYSSQKEHLSRYLEAGVKMASYIKHRKGDVKAYDNSQ